MGIMESEALASVGTVSAELLLDDDSSAFPGGKAILRSKRRLIASLQNTEPRSLRSKLSRNWPAKNPGVFFTTSWRLLT